jgi:hypothetical protein
MKAPLHGLLAALLALATGSSGSQQLTVVQLHHRSAESLITVLRPLVAPAVVTGAGTQLQVRALPMDLPRVRQLIEQSDRPLQALAIALRDEAPNAADANLDSQPRPGSGSVSGSVTLATGRDMPPDPVGNGQILSTQPGRRRTRVVEGEPLRISMPVPQSLWFGVKPKAAGAPPGGSVSSGTGAQGVVHFDAVSDVTARIWLADATVAIELQPLAAGGVDAGLDRSSDQATVYGKVGQWIALADSGTDLQAPFQVPPQGTAASRAGLWIKVDPAPDAAGSPR